MIDEKPEAGSEGGIGQSASTGELDGIQPCCFNCDSLGGGYYKPHEGQTTWYIGHLDGQGHYACEDCKDALFDAALLAPNGEFSGQAAA